jgi:membrane protease subunit HflK
VTLRRLYIETMQDILTHAQTTVLDDQAKNILPFLPLSRTPAMPPAPGAKP